jgi:hypothetical protein
MNSYEKLLALMDSPNSPLNIYTGIMDGPDTCHRDKDNLPLDADDLLIADHLKTQYVKDVTLVDNQLDVEYIEPLKKGDIVILMKLSDTQYAILERVV